MNARIPLRIAAVFTAMQAVAHTFGGVLGPIGPGAQTVAANAMKSNGFDAFGHTRTYWDFFIGFGLCVSVFLAMEAGLLWSIARSIDFEPARWRAVLWLLFLSNLGIAILGVYFFFPATVVSPGINLICLGLAMAQKSRQPSHSEVNP